MSWKLWKHRKSTTVRDGIWIPWEIWQLSELHPNERVLLAVVAGFEANGLTCFASNSHFAELLGVSTDRARKCIYNLIEAGYLEREEGGRAGTGRWLRTHRGVGVDAQGGGRKRPHTIQSNKSDTRKPNYGGKNFEKGGRPRGRDIDELDFAALVKRKYGNDPT